MPPPFLIIFLAISVSSLTSIPCLSESSSRPWLPRTCTCFKCLLQMKARFVSSLQVTFSWITSCCNDTAGEDLPTPNTNEIVVFSSFFQHGFSLPTYDFFRGLLHHYQIKLVHLNPNSIFQIAIFIHLCEAFLCIPPNFPLLKNYFFLKYQPSAANRKVIRGVGLQTRPRTGFLDLAMKSSLQRWHMTWFYCENHEPSLPPFVGRLPEYQGSWSEEPTPLELPHVALTIKINFLKEHDLTGVCMAAHWLARRVVPLKKQVHPGWEYSRVQDQLRRPARRLL
jgi:hypothetical protein